MMDFNFADSLSARFTRQARRGSQLSALSAIIARDEREREREPRGDDDRECEERGDSKDAAHGIL